MTHSLHRRGTRENLANDFVIYCAPAPGFNTDGAGPKQRRFLEIALRNDLDNAGFTGYGNLVEYSRKDMLEQGSGGAVHICCSNKQAVIKILKETLAEDLGLSIVVQGVVTEVEDCLKQLGLKMHTVHHSLGIWGKTEKLPDNDILEITTMCGHGLVGKNLVAKAIDGVLTGNMTIPAAAKLLARPCRCGIFNINRTEALLERIAARSKV
jgi:hypothetical protein